MQERLKAPIFKARKIKDVNEWAEGHLHVDTIKRSMGMSGDIEHNGYFIQEVNSYKGYKASYEVDIKTLKISTDGEVWVDYEMFSLDMIKETC